MLWELNELNKFKAPEFEKLTFFYRYEWSNALRHIYHSKNGKRITEEDKEINSQTNVLPASKELIYRNLIPKVIVKELKTLNT